MKSPVVKTHLRIGPMKSLNKLVHILNLVQLLMFGIIGCLSYPSIEIRDSYSRQTKAIRLANCQFDDVLHTNCYSCARLYDSHALFKDCCQGVDTILAELCASGV
ncbi:hypothetical protein DPMN_094340 [Dreissena polymorpha]|uniref:Uncharacterized protein n=1 Tax=Dreissena polymorpha TaxID=45954 RepID=A0A9D4L5Y4_DREPO|nr:hypothetical protein DPMN_094340 [Dreissena polymorpha]